MAAAPTVVANLTQLRELVDTMFTYQAMSLHTSNDLVHAVRVNRLKFADTLTKNEALDILTYFAENPIGSLLALPDLNEKGVLALTQSFSHALRNLNLSEARRRRRHRL